MKKLSFILAMLILFTASIMVTSCGEESADNKTVDESVKSSDILAKIMENFSDQTSGLTYTSEDSEDDIEYFTTMLGANEFGDGFEFPELEVIDEYAVFLPGERNIFTIAVFKAKTDADISTITALFSNKINSVKNNPDIKSYDDAKGTLQTMANNGTTYTAGKYVILLITSDNKAAEKSAQDIIYK